MPANNNNNIKIANITEEILNSKKYSHIERKLVERICEETIPKYRQKSDIIKAVKKELHIIHGSFLSENCHTQADKLIDAYSGHNIKADKTFALKLMALHASTRERLKQAPEIYLYLSSFIKAEDTVIDIGCGFNPLALPFYDTLPKSYFAFDISISTIHTLTKYFALANFPYQAEIYDAVTQTPRVQTDVALLLKLFPLLERQKKGSAFSILNAISFRSAIVSFPLKSASGKEKGMETFYALSFEKGLPQELEIADKTIFKNEMFYAVRRKSSCFIR